MLHPRACLPAPVIGRAAHRHAGAFALPCPTVNGVIVDGGGQKKESPSPRERRVFPLGEREASPELPWPTARPRKPRHHGWLADLQARVGRGLGVSARLKRNPYQIGESLDLELMHHPRAAIFDSAATDAQIRGDRLVRFALQHLIENRTLGGT